VEAEVVAQVEIALMAYKLEMQQVGKRLAVAMVETKQAETLVVNLVEAEVVAVEILILLTGLLIAACLAAQVEQVR
jgi:hypothetical protein